MARPRGQISGDPLNESVASTQAAVRHHRCCSIVGTVRSALGESVGFVPSQQRWKRRSTAPNAVGSPMRERRVTHAGPSVDPCDARW